MAAVTAQEGARLGQALVEFAREGTFPEEDIVSSTLQGSQLGAALETLTRARQDVESEIRTVSRDSAVDVDSWIKTAQTIQDDIDRSRALASDIVRQAEASDSLTDEEKTAEAHVEFLLREVLYSTQVYEALQKTQEAKRLLDEVELAGSERRILDALSILDQAWSVIYEIPTFENSRAVGILSQRAQDLRDSLRQTFDKVWSAIFHIDVNNNAITITSDAEYGGMNLQDALLAMQAFKESEHLAQKLYLDINKTIVAPRTDLSRETVVAIKLEGNTLTASGESSDRTIKSLLSDMEIVIQYFAERLPPQLAAPLSQVLMPALISQITGVWLDSAIPASLGGVPQLKDALVLLRSFADVVNDMKWHGSDELYSWIDNAPKHWLTKRREASLDWTRSQLALGIGTTRQVERVETRTISKIESEQFGAGTQLDGNGNDWDAAWSDDGKDLQAKDNTAPAQPTVEDDDFDAWDDGPNEALEETQTKSEEPKAEAADEEDDAWGWGDEDTNPVDESQTEPTNAARRTGKIQEKATENGASQVTLTETFTISTLPEKVLEVIIGTVEDGLTLSQQSTEDNPVAPAAVGLFSLPTLILAMYRAASAFYYNKTPGGSMYLYNDAMWLSEQLRNHDRRLKGRDDLPRAASRLTLEADANLLQSFAKRGYSTEMNTQRTILSDLMGGSQNLISAGDGEEDMLIAIDAVMFRIREVSSQWEKVLSKSAWAQAIGSLISGIAGKIITDVEDLPSLGADEAYKVANMISKVVGLDDLFMPDSHSPGYDHENPPIPLTAQYVPNWLKLHFLSEVLQSDLKDIKFLWFESDLSLYYTADEVIDLIKLSFEINPRTREAIHSIRDNPNPRD